MAFTTQSFTSLEQPTLAKWNVLNTNDQDLNTRVGTARGFNSNAGVATLSASYADFATVTTASLGGVVTIEVGGLYGNANSGASRTMDIKILCDGTDVSPSPITGIYCVYEAGVTIQQTFHYVVSHTPTAASHTWKIQVKASSATAVKLGTNFIHVTECG